MTLDEEKKYNHMMWCVKGRLVPEDGQLRAWHVCTTVILNVCGAITNFATMNKALKKPGKGNSMNKQERIQQLQDDWNNNPRWDTVTRSYTAEQVVDLQLSLIHI